MDEAGPDHRVRVVAIFVNMGLYGSSIYFIRICQLFKIVLIFFFGRQSSDKPFFFSIQGFHLRPIFRSFGGREFFAERF